MDLVDHEMASERRYRDLRSHIHEIKDEVLKEEEEIKMSTQPLNIFEGGSGGGMGAAMGGGLGAGLLGGVLGGALLGGNRGLLGNGVGVGAVEGVVTPMQLQTATGSIIDAGQNTAVLQGIGDIKAAVPLAEAQAQLAIAQSQAAITQSIGQTENAILLGQNSINKAVTDAIAASLASQNNINLNVSAQGAATRESVAAFGQANLVATKDSQYAIANAIRDDGDKTRALIINQDMATLQRQLAVAESALLDERSAGRSRLNEVNITQTVNQNQAQLQAQQQQQQQLLLLNSLCNTVAGLQNAVATNSNLIVGNTGAVATGPQTANPVNVRA